jgi:hypothetical protein
VGRAAVPASPPDFAQRFGGNFKSIFARAQCIASDDPRFREKEPALFADDF